MGAILEAFHAIADDRPNCFVAYTIKGFGLPFAGHKDNHAGLMNLDQMASFRRGMKVPDGAEWDRFAGLDLPRRGSRRFSTTCRSPDPRRAAIMPRPVPVPASLPVPRGERQSTQEAFGRLLGEIAARRRRAGAAHRDHLARRDGLDQSRGWVNRRGVFDRAERADMFREENVARRSNGGCRRRASTSSSASPRTICSCCSRHSACRRPQFGDAAAADRHASTIRSSTAASMR